MHIGSVCPSRHRVDEVRRRCEQGIDHLLDAGDVALNSQHSMLLVVSKTVGTKYEKMKKKENDTQTTARERVSQKQDLSSWVGWYLRMP
jgi:hypothetical protein